MSSPFSKGKTKIIPIPTPPDRDALGKDSIIWFYKTTSTEGVEKTVLYLTGAQVGSVGYLSEYKPIILELHIKNTVSINTLFEDYEYYLLEYINFVECVGLISMMSTFFGNKNLRSITYTGDNPFVLVEYGDSAFHFCTLFDGKNLAFPALSSGPNMFANCSLLAPAIDAILTSLPTWTDEDHTITFTGCPGAATCTPSIGTLKGWVVET